jgi:predicted TIM-barrel fold metal-dependent hydrolase
LSPAAPELDPFWDLVERANTPVVFHVGGEGSFMRSRAWRENVDNFTYKNVDTLELTVEPYTLSTNHYAPQNFLTAMVLGGVFERHPDLRVGVMELAGHWVGPLADNLDMWAINLPQFKRLFDTALSMRPSEYLKRNLRVSPFHFEPVDEYLARHPHLEDVFCFATDYPHREGGTSPIIEQWERVAPLGATTVENFFSRNGEWLLPRR